MPPRTATTGMMRMLSENTVTGTDVASLIHAQCAKAKATSTLYVVPIHALAPMCANACTSSSKSAPTKIGTPPSSMIHAV